jgi:Tol biopolymer transport system component
LAFTQTVVLWKNGDYRSPHFTAVCVVDTDGSNHTEVYRTGGVEGDLAWSHDGTRVALVAVRDGIDTSGQPAPSLLVLDVTERPARVVLQRPLKREHSPVEITTQAWAPDDRRLVFSSGAGRMRMLNLQSGVEVDLGPGQEPTWSRDGTQIAFRLDIDHSFGGYWLVSPEEPSDRGSILSNSPSLTDQLAFRGPFVGPAIWSPDGKYLLLSRLVGLGEFQRPYVLELATRNVEALPAGSMGGMRSWAGVP